jgi:hypothetical protein
MCVTEEDFASMSRSLVEKEGKTTASLRGSPFLGKMAG